MSNRTVKQQKFTANKKNNRPIYVAIGLFMVVVVAAGIYLMLGKSNSPSVFNIGSPVTYSQTVQMTDVNNTVENGKIAVNLEEVKKDGIVYTEYNQNGKKLALTAWVAQNGNVIAAVSMCEPCNGFKFHIEGNELVCNSCGTRWTLDTLQGVSGGCTKYPPDALKYEVKDGKILLDEAQVVAWEPRVF